MVQLSVLESAFFSTSGKFNTAARFMYKHRIVIVRLPTCHVVYRDYIHAQDMQHYAAQLVCPQHEAYYALRDRGQNAIEGIRPYAPYQAHEEDSHCHCHCHCHCHGHYHCHPPTLTLKTLVATDHQQRNDNATC